MTNEESIDCIIDLLRESEISLEQACRDYPHLIPAITRKWSQIQKVEQELDRWFPNDVRVLAPTPSTKLPTISGYEVLSEIGRGGMGVVFRARDTRLNRQVAIKTILGGLYSTQAERLRFQREAQSFAAIDHPNIVKLFEFGDLDGDPYFAMELVEGQNLQETIDRGKLSPRESATLVSKLAQAIQSVHDHGIIHRDIKPSNVLVNSIGEPKLTDFGLARILDGQDSLTRAGAILGTPSYMSPEQAQGPSRNIGLGSDIYSLGAILFACLTSHPPFQADSPALLLQQVINAEPKPPSKNDERIPRDLDCICLKCLQKESKHRYIKASDLALDLERFLAGEAIHARAESRASMILRRIRRNPIRSAVVSLVVAIGTLVLIVQCQLALDKANLNTILLNDRKSRETQAATLLQSARRAIEAAQWNNATHLVNSSRVTLGDGVEIDQLKTIVEFERWIQVGSELDKIRLSGFANKNGELSFEETDVRYRELFEESGIGKVSENPKSFISNVQASPIRGSLVGAIDHWRACTKNEEDRSWLLGVVDKVDSITSEWRRDAMSPQVFSDAAFLRDVISRAPESSISVPLLLAQEIRTKSSNDERIRFLKAVQQFAPSDFWANQRLGDVLMYTGKPIEAVGYYQVAVALRGDVAISRNNLAHSLISSKRFEEAEREYEKVVNMEPNLPFVRISWIRVLHALGKHEDVIAQRDILTAQVPPNAMFRILLGTSLENTQELEEARSEFEKALETDPNNFDIQKEVRGFLLRQNNHREAYLRWSQWSKNANESHDVYYGLAELALFLGHNSDYEVYREDLLQRFENSSDVHILERTARSGLLAIANNSQLARIRKMSEPVCKLNRTEAGGAFPFFQFVKALVLFRQGDLEASRAILVGDAANVLKPVPKLILCMIMAAKGELDEAKTTFTEADDSYDWSINRALDQDAWIRHIFRREAKQTLQSKLNDLKRLIK